MNHKRLALVTIYSLLLCATAVVSPTSLYAQDPLPPNNQAGQTGGVQPQCKAAQVFVTVKIINNYGDPWPTGTPFNTWVSYYDLDYVKGVVIGELGGDVAPGPAAWNDQVVRAKSIVARTFAAYKCKNRESTGLYNTDADQVYRPARLIAANTTQSDIIKQRYQTQVGIYEGVYAAYNFKDVSATALYASSQRLTAWPIDAEYRASNSNPTANWSAAYPYLPSVNNNYESGPSGPGFSQMGSQSLAIAGDAQMNFWGLIAHYYPNSHLVHTSYSGSGTWNGAYYSTPSATGCGSGLLANSNPLIDMQFEFDAGPTSGASADGWCAKFTRADYFDETNTYTFYVGADDGFKITIDGVDVLNFWTRISPHWIYSVAVPLTQGNHTIEFHYRDVNGPSSARIFWRKYSGAVGHYYNGKISSTPFEIVPLTRLMQRFDVSIGFNWQSNYSPLNIVNPPAGFNTIGADNFSSMWRGYIYSPYCRLFTVQTRSDDGIKVSINTNGVTTVLIDNWTDHAPVDNTGSITLCQGTHWFEVRHYENTGSATAKATWFF